MKDKLNTVLEHRALQRVPIKWRLPLLIAILVGVLAFFFLGGKPLDWWNGSWTIRKTVTLDTTGIDGTIGAAPVLVRLHDGNFQADQAQDGGGDLRFIADGKPLKYHIEKFDSLLNEALVWVQVPDAKAAGKLWLYYGSSNTTAPGGPDPKGGYDDATLLVYHFAEAPGQAPKDASGHGNDATSAGTVDTSSFIGSGLKMEANTAVLLPDTLTWSDALTWSAWVAFPAVQPNAVIFSAPGSLTVGIDNGVPYADFNGQRTSGGAPIAPNAWSHLAVVADKGVVTLYLNGAAYGTLNIPALPAPSGAARIGGGFVGQIDELEISKAARPAGWVKFAALSQGQDTGAKVVALGDDKAIKGGGGPGFYGVILRSVTIDGWVIIAVLVGMGFVSWRVMLAKWKYLQEIAAANALFVKEWRRVATDLTQLDHGDVEKSKTMGGRLTSAVQESSLYRLYHIGAEEIRHRLGQESAKYLSAQSIQAIRASLDAGLVRESERLNDKMVILTISISGGPFVGLLGTVAGVMITFAAIAAAGEVNVNSIAPGISAALVATVAGLLVAIPALFGYNLLTTRIDAAIGDMQVFIDEYVTKMAEFYRGRVPVGPLNGSSDGLLDELVARLAKATRN